MLQGNLAIPASVEEGEAAASEKKGNAGNKKKSDARDFPIRELADKNKTRGLARRIEGTRKAAAESVVLGLKSWKREKGLLRHDDEKNRKILTTFEKT